MRVTKANAHRAGHRSPLHRATCISLAFLAMLAAPLCGSFTQTADARSGDYLPGATKFLGSQRAILWDFIDWTPTVARAKDGGLLAIAGTGGEFVGDTYFVSDSPYVRIIRTNAHGRIDRKFAHSRMGRGLKVGRGHYEMQPGNLTVGPDGRAYVTMVGSPSMGNLYSSAIVAFNQRTGRLIRSFGKNGILRYGGETARRPSYGHYKQAFQLLPLADGSLLDCGYGYSFKKNNRFAYLAKYKPNGRFDKSFGGDGRLDFTTIYPGQKGRKAALVCNSVMVDRAGRTLVAWTGKITTSVRKPVAWVTRHLADGTLDPSFGQEGRVFIRPRDYNPAISVFDDVARAPVRPVAMRELPSGDIVVAGALRAWPYLQPADDWKPASFRLTSDGHLDLSYGTNGIFYSWAIFSRRPIVDEDGSVVFSGQAPKAQGYKAAMLRVGPTGVPDANFGVGGLSLSPRRLAGSLEAIVAIRPNSYMVWGWREVKPYGKDRETEVWEISRVER